MIYEADRRRQREKNTDSFVGMYKDASVRFNSLFQEAGWGFINPTTTSLADSPIEVLTLMNNGSAINITVRS